MSKELEALDKYIKLCNLSEIDFYSKDDREWKGLKKHLIENVEEYEMNKTQQLIDLCKNNYKCFTNNYNRVIIKLSRKEF